MKNIVLKDRQGEELYPVTSSNLVAHGESNVGEILDTKQDVLVSGVNIKTVNGQSLLGAGNTELGLPIASNDTLGGIKVGPGLSINNETGVLSVTGDGQGSESPSPEDNFICRIIPDKTVVYGMKEESIVLDTQKVYSNTTSSFTGALLVHKYKLDGSNTQESYTGRSSNVTSIQMESDVYEVSVVLSYEDRTESINVADYVIINRVLPINSQEVLSLVTKYRSPGCFLSTILVSDQDTTQYPISATRGYISGQSSFRIGDVILDPLDNLQTYVVNSVSDNGSTASLEVVHEPSNI